MAKEKKRGFLSWLGFNRQDDDAVGEPEAGRETDATGAGGETDAPVATTAARGEAADAAEEALAEAKAQTSAAERTSSPEAKAQTSAAERTSSPEAKAQTSAAERISASEAKAQTPAAERTSSPDVPVRERDAQRIAADIVSLTEQVATRRSHAGAGVKTPMAAASAAENDAVAPPSSDNGIAPLAKKTDAVAPPSSDNGIAPLAKKTDAVAPPSSDNGIAPLAKNADAIAPPSKNDAVAAPFDDDAAPSEDGAVASSIVIADAAAPENRQDASAALTLAADVIPDEDTVPRPAEDGVPPAPERAGFFARLKNSLVKTRQNLGSGFIGLFRGKKIDDDLFEELEEQLLVADVGVETTRKIIEGLTAHAERRHLKDAEALYSQLRVDMAAILANVERPLEVTGKTPFVILMVGVNGVGKTTTIGKLARQYQAEGKSVMLAAGDTFRAAAVEQLQVWGERNRIPVVAQQTGADSASVIFDAIQAAKARGIDVLIADTAGRLQNKAHLMDELKKIVRVMKKLDVEAPHEVMLTLDASTGQNAVSQANLFNDAVGLTGIALTKLDGTAKGGVIFAVADRFGIPIRYIGVGEGIEDLRPFKADDFIEALFARED
ncbi:signal recognition particle-docking protein FtsY [Sodalis endosymbiont of Spalangia cameroni]|uniref:signal recognition particle-docking protein FtsY n=1 Tax=Sodalis praecaptivus TaxID=1239307 RepID=UPI0031F72EC9